MREIKFRVWDKNGKPAQMYIDPYLISLPTIRLSKAMEEIAEDGWEWMQYTGLKDKNGKEIYEGDIVKCSYHGDWIGEIYWCEDRGQWWCDDFSLYELRHIEIIGNIYENPEFIGEQ